MDINNNLLNLMKSIDFSCKKHRDQRRKDSHSTPYINHPIGVTYKLTQAGINDFDILQAAILHDTVEDTNTTEEELVKEFGRKVATIVMEVTDDKSESKADRKRHQIEHAKHISKEAKSVKLADKLFNLSDIQTNAPPSWSIDVIQGYFIWAKAVIQNLRGTNQILESQLDEIFSSTFIKGDKHYPTIPCTPEEEPKLLENYYKIIIML
ncbi:hypothetical protein DICPUDRAFT_155188 [Dictyostelium purpureum]|uniref:Guanosine-3',5'-bis(diphosphate) 3'-pyrophosphohydrolase MESH1 n=1 Tax=Dictyostelium purpureum TaxID=5786 RepID=F0ZTB3_DICPU|nr:uncharacterized protein DICPUDRAFT_155188 [Dictyostelium purpureum]EGC32834.1 hypothetical protein DICPUDRAFT_155188 [Dictyostelium purpureum]|eukprot:XP_003290657.1 hypothetical protein DICPUDRAFT_155188 [Dictyostelium purpureum]